MICRFCENLACCIAYSIRENEQFDPDDVEKCDEFKIFAEICSSEGHSHPRD